MCNISLIEPYLNSSLEHLAELYSSQENYYKLGWVADVSSFERWIQMELGWIMSRAVYHPPFDGIYYTSPETQLIDLPIYEQHTNHHVASVEIKCLYNNVTSFSLSSTTKAMNSILKDVKKLQRSNILPYLCIVFVYRVYANGEHLVIKEINSPYELWTRIKDQIKQKMVNDPEVISTLRWIGPNPIVITDQQDDPNSKDYYYQRLNIALQFARVEL